MFEFSSANGRTCQAKLEFSRVLPALPSTFRSHNKTDWGLSAGLHVATGSLGDSIGQVGVSRALALSWFPAMQHGIRFEVGMDDLHSNRFALGLLLMPSYEYRAFFSPRLSYSFGIGAGAYLCTVRDGVPTSSSRWALMVRERMQLAVDLFPQWVSLELGPAVTFGVLPGGPFGPRELTGALYCVRGLQAGLMSQRVRVHSPLGCERSALATRTSSGGDGRALVEDGSPTFPFTSPD